MSLLLLSVSGKLQPVSNILLTNTSKHTAGDVIVVAPVLVHHKVWFVEPATTRFFYLLIAFIMDLTASVGIK